uniref:Variant surface glycoprotein 1125.2958 n=1 Tax=Trypanosoma brucei TaxID=5691 RepID=A0A1J0R9F2_9TRYP|nr:variant surface glycoprotein 1125.2958 [Trypanosoma brucei]
MTTVEKSTDTNCYANFFLQDTKRDPQMLSIVFTTTIPITDEKTYRRLTEVMYLLCFVSVCARDVCGQSPKNANCTNADTAAVFAGELTKATIEAMHPEIDHLTRRAQYELIIATHPSSEVAKKAVPLLALQTKCQQRDKTQAKKKVKTMAAMLAALGQDTGHMIAITRLVKASIKAAGPVDGGNTNAKFLKITYDNQESGLDDSKCTLLDYLTTETEATDGAAILKTKIQVQELKLDSTDAASGAETPMACGAATGCTSSSSQTGSQVGIKTGKL